MQEVIIVKFEILPPDIIFLNILNQSCTLKI